MLLHSASGVLDRRWSSLRPVVSSSCLLTELLATSFAVVPLGVLDSLQQLSVGDTAVCNTVELSELTLLLALVILLLEETAAQELVQLVLIDDVPLVLDRARVSSLVDQLRHQLALLLAIVQSFVLHDQGLFLLDVLATALEILKLTGALSIGSLLLLDLGELELLHHALLGEIVVLVLLLVVHDSHLAILLLLESLIHL